MYTRWLSALSIGLVVACGRDRQENASNAAGDTVAMVTPGSGGAAATGTVVPEARTGSGPSASSSAPASGGRAGTAERPVLVVQVQEEVPGLLEQAKYHPLDAQHIAQGKYPRGMVQAGWLERRGKNLVYRFRVRDEDGTLHDVLVDSFRGDIINTIPVQ